MRNLYDVRATAERCNNKFFSRDAMRFFNARTCDSLTRVSPVDGSVWFVSSERPDDDLYGGRRYTVRRAAVRYVPVRWEDKNQFQSWAHHDDYGMGVERWQALTDSIVDLGANPVWGVTFTIDTVGEFMEYPTRKAAYAGLVHAMMAAHKEN